MKEKFFYKDLFCEEKVKNIFADINGKKILAVGRGGGDNISEKIFFTDLTFFQSMSFSGETAFYDVGGLDKNRADCRFLNVKIHLTDIPFTRCLQFSEHLYFLCKSLCYDTTFFINYKLISKPDFDELRNRLNDFEGLSAHERLDLIKRGKELKPE